MARIVIRSALDYAHIGKWGGYRQWIAHLTGERWRGSVPIWIPGNGPHTQAEIIRANWVARCPACNTYILIEPGELFFCPDCRMEQLGGHAVIVIWPDNQDELVHVLASRTDPMTRNWAPPETADDLRRENAEHKED